MGLLAYLRNFFGVKGRNPEDHQSGFIAKRRLRQVLSQDRADIPAQFMRAIRYDIINSASKYMDVDEKGARIEFIGDEGNVFLLAEMPVAKIQCRDKNKGSLVK